MRFVRSALTVAAFSMLAACSVANDIEQASTTSGDCERCHALPPAQGAHLAHALAGTYSTPLACGSCHVIPEVRDHANRTVDIEFSALAAKDVAKPAYADGRCAVYCHGSTDALGDRTSPAWTSTGSIVCGSCHTLSPTSGWHTGHLRRGIACAKCHPGYSTSPPAVTLAKHVNGILEASPVNTDATFSSWPDECGACHSAQPPPL